MWEKDIIHGCLIVIDFDDGKCKCVYEGVMAGKICYIEFTKKGKLYKKASRTGWNMWEYIKKHQPSTKLETSNY
jgi:hypothetical protein